MGNNIPNQVSLSMPLRISSVRVEGTQQTRASFLGAIIDPIISLPPPDNKQTLEHVLFAVRDINHKLRETDNFKCIEIILARSSDRNAAEHDVEVIVKAREKGRYFLKTATEVGNGEGNAVSSFKTFLNFHSVTNLVLKSVTGHIRNVFGGAETFEAHLSLGTTTRRSFSAIFAAPLTNDLRTRGELSVYGMERDNTSYASLTEGLRGIRAVVRVS
jgi:outer membrane protein insertion porin family